MPRIFAIPVLWALLVCMPAGASRYALLIGCNNGGETVGTLKFAESDAANFAGLLIRYGGFDRADVTTLLGPDSASLDAQLRSAARALSSSKAAPSDLFLLYYSGHSDGRNLLLGKTAFPLRMVQARLDSMRAGVKIGIFDACQSGAVTTYKGGKRAEPFYLERPQKIKGQVIIASAAANERAQESESLKGSIFSFYWLSGLRGSADASGDRKITLTEAYNYAYRKTVETSTLTGGEAQHPMYRFAIHGQGDIVLTDLVDRGGGIVFDKSCEGKFLVLSDSYTDIFADFFKKRNSESFVTLDPGRYTVINANNGVVGMFTCSVDENSRFSLASSMLVPNTLSESRIKGANPAMQAALAGPKTTPLSLWSCGAGIGAGSPPVSGKGPAAFSLSFANAVYLSDRSDLFFNAGYYTGGVNLSADVGLDAVRRYSGKELFAGIGAGVYYRERAGVSERVAPSVTGRFGFAFDVGRRTQASFVLPCAAILGSSTVWRAGIEFRLLFSGPYKNVAVLHL